MLKMTGTNPPKDVVWTCTEALELDAKCVKAYYRRAIAYIAMDSSTTLVGRCRLTPG